MGGGLLGLRLGAGAEVGPRGRDQGPTAVRQDEDEMEPILSVRLTQDGEGLPLKGVVSPDDGHALREVLVMGSV